MSARAAITAFAGRGARRGGAATLLVYSGLVTAALVALAAWIAPLERAHEVELAQLRGDATAAMTDWPARWSTLALADLFALAVLATVGFVLAPALVAVTVAQERRAGTLDQLRTTPLSPVQLALGFVVGGPAKLYLLCAGPLALHVLATLAGALPWSTLPAALVLLALGTVSSCLVALAAALATRHETGGLQALALAAALGALALTAGAMPGSLPLAKWASLHPAGALSALLAGAPSLWQRLLVDAEPSEAHLLVLGALPLVSLLLTAIMGAVLLRAAARKLGAPERPLLSKAQALTLFALAALSLLIPAEVGPRRAWDLLTAIGCAFLSVPLLVLLGALCTPSAESWARALRAGGRRRWYDDDAAPHLTMWLMVAGWLALALAPVAPAQLELGGDGRSLALAWALVAVLTLPVYVHFGATRYTSMGARAAFAVAVVVLLVGQLIALVQVADGYDGLGPLASLFVVACAPAAVAAPAGVALAQRALARRQRA